MKAIHESDFDGKVIICCFCESDATYYKMEVLDIHQLIGGVTKYDKKVALEVKKPKSWCKSVSTFANGIGGRLIWGIANDKTIGRS